MSACITPRSPPICREMPVYDFLEVVRTVSRKHENISCSGFDVDDLMDEDGYNEICSPELDASIGKPTFDDDSEIEWKTQNGASMKNWEKGNSTWEKISATSDGWGIQKMPSSGNAQGDAAKPDVWSSWHAGDMQEKPVESTVVADEVNPLQSFGKVELRDRNSDSGQSDHTNSWETKIAKNRAKLNQPKSPAVWNANVSASPGTQSWNSSSKLGNWSCQPGTGGSNTTVWDNQISQKAVAGDPSDVGGWRKTESENGWGRAKQLPEKNGWNASVTGTTGNTESKFEESSSLPMANAWVQKSSDVGEGRNNRSNDQENNGWKTQGWGSSGGGSQKTNFYGPCLCLSPKLPTLDT